jgi:hypothetical protein
LIAFISSSFARLLLLTTSSLFFLRRTFFHSFISAILLKYKEEPFVSRDKKGRVYDEFANEAGNWSQEAAKAEESDVYERMRSFLRRRRRHHRNHE